MTSERLTGPGREWRCIERRQSLESLPDHEWRERELLKMVTQVLACRAMGKYGLDLERVIEIFVSF